MLSLAADLLKSNYFNTLQLFVIIKHTQIVILFWLVLSIYDSNAFDFTKSICLLFCNTSLMIKKTACFG